MLPAPHADGVAVSADGARAPSTTGIVPRRRVRVIFVNDTARNGGPGRSLLCILKGLDPAFIHRTVILPHRGVVSDLFAAAGAADDIVFEPNLVENLVAPLGRPIVRADFSAPLAVRGLRLAANLGRGAFGIGRLGARARRSGADLLYCNGSTADFAGGVLAASTRIAVLWHVRYTSVPGPLRRLHDRLAASGGVRRIICVSHAAARLFPHCREKVRIVPNGIDLDEFSAVGPARLRSELGLHEDVVVFGSQGRILRRKGYVEMIHAARRAIDRMTSAERARCHFAVLGDTPQDFKSDHLAECRALIGTLGLEKDFTMLGFTPDVTPYVRDFDVGVVPSVYPDPLPRAVMESMALGKPVVAFDVGGIAEMLSDGIEGAVVPCGDVEALAGQFLRYLRDPVLRRRQGEAARARIERDFDGRAHARIIHDEIVRTAGLG